MGSAFRPALSALRSDNSEYENRQPRAQCDDSRLDCTHYSHGRWLVAGAYRTEWSGERSARNGGDHRDSIYKSLDCRLPVYGVEARSPLAATHF